MPNISKDPGAVDGSSWITAAIALFAVAMFVVIGAQVMPSYLGLLGPEVSAQPGLTSAFLLNISLILFAWRRSKDLKSSSEGRAAAEARANHLAYNDDTTGLANRRFLIERLASADAARDGVLSLILIDVDNFKTVNDMYGHSAGDRLLLKIAERIKLVAPSDAVCARLGGDEFAILLAGPHAQPDKAGVIAEHLLAEINKPIELEATEAQVSVSIGLSTLDSTDESYTSLIHRSDIAMYESKNQGRNCLTWFDYEMERALNDRNTLESEMRRALAEDHFVPYFQPLLDIKSGTVKGFEVLARWHHPEKGLIEPDTFISIAESTGMIAELSMTVMRKALIHARTWPHELTIAVNISPVQFKDPLLAQRIVKLLTEVGFNPRRLELEITESTLLDNPELTFTTVESLKNHGIRISLDDFGTGYASLTQLRSLPFDRIKIDRSFVSSLLEDDQSNAIVHAIATLGSNLHLPITAEGVETESVYRRLESLGCSDVQGWLIGKALPAEDTIRIFLDTVPPPREPQFAAKPDVAPLIQDKRSYARRGGARK